MRKANSKRRRIASAALFIFGAIFFAWGNNFNTPAVGLDPSWAEALVQATDQNMRFGRDIIFTFGPYHQIYTNQISHNLAPFLIGRFIMGLAFGAMWMSLARLTSLAWGFTMAATLGLAIPHMFSPAPLDTTVPLLNFTFLLCSVLLPVSWLSEASLLAMYGGIIISVLAKLSFLGSAVACAPAAIALRACVIDKTHPLKRITVAVLALMVPPLLWALSGQSIDGFSTYFLGGNLDIISGYSTAMSSTSEGNRWQIAFYITASCFCLYSTDQYMRPKLGSYGGHARRWLRSSILLSLFLLIWIVFKAGMVRHDAHAYASGIFIFTLAMMCVALKNTIPQHQSRHPASTLTNALMLMAGLSIASTYANPSKQNPLTIFTAHLANAKNTLALSAHSKNHEQLLRILRENRLKVISRKEENFNIPQSSSADILPWDISSIVSKGYRYRPRPIIQSYSAYTTKLQRINQDHFLSINRPDYVAIKLQSIDGRPPLELDGPALLAIAQNYCFDSYGSKGSLLFHSRASFPCPTSETNKTTKAIIKKKRDEEIITIRPTSRLSACNKKTCPLAPTLSITNPSNQEIVAVHAKQNLMGKLLSTLFKPGEITLKLKNGNNIETYRIIPGAINLVPLRKLQIEDLKNFMAAQSKPPIHQEKGPNEKFIQAHPVSLTFESTDRFSTIETIVIIRNPNDANLFSTTIQHQPS